MTLAVAGCVPPGLQEHHELCLGYIGPGLAESWLFGGSVVVDLQSDRREEAALDDWHYLYVEVLPRSGLPALQAYWDWPSSDLVNTSDPAWESALGWTEFPLESGSSYEVAVYAEWSSRPERDGILNRCVLSQGRLPMD